MDILTIMSYLRNVTGRHTENELPTLELLRAVNNAYRTRIVVPLWESVKSGFVLNDVIKASVSGNYSDKPDNCESIINVYVNDKLCYPVSSDEKALLGNNVNYPSDSNFPFYIDEGVSVYLFPSLSSATVKYDFYRRPFDLFFGKGTVTGGTTLSITEGRYIPGADIYKDVKLSLYTVSAGTMTLKHEVNVTTSADNQLTIDKSISNTSYIIAMQPLVPDKVGSFISEATLIDLGKTGIVSDDRLDAAKGIIENLTGEAA